MDITPSRIEWRGPNDYHVVLDEDQVSLRSRGSSLEEPEIATLLRVIAEAQRCRDAGTAPTPAAPTCPF